MKLTTLIRNFATNKESLAALFAVIVGCLSIGLAYFPTNWVFIFTAIVGSSVVGVFFYATSNSKTFELPRMSVFIAHSHEDASFAQKLAGDISDMGFVPRLAYRELVVGMDIHKEIDRVIISADAFLAIITPAFKNSSWAAQELKIAMNSEKLVMPAVIEKDAIPESIAGLFYADFSTNYDVGRDAIYRSLRRFRILKYKKATEKR